MSNTGEYAAAAASASPPPPQPHSATPGGPAVARRPAAGGAPAGAAGAAAVTQGDATQDPDRPAVYLGARDVPSGLARWQALLTTGVIVWALLTAALLGNSWDKTRSGAANTAQVTRIHAIESSLFQADAIATNAFLVGGLESVEQRQNYDAALEEVSRLITESARAQPADTAALVALNHEVLRYAEQMQQARANNRQGLPVGAQYLREASQQLRSDILPILVNLIDANTDRAAGSLSGHWTMLVALPGVGLIVVLLWFHQQLAHLFRRRINVGLAAAIGLLLVATVAAVAVTASVASDANALKRGEFATASDVASARTAANDAKSNESLRLIARGSGAKYEETWVAKDAEVVDLVEDRAKLADLWEEYRAGHAEIVAADEGGAWDKAVQLAVDREPGSVTADFVEFDNEAQAQIGMANKAVVGTSNAGTIRTAIMVVAIVIAAGLALAALSWGVTLRRKEFA